MELLDPFGAITLLGAITHFCYFSQWLILINVYNSFFSTLQDKKPKTKMSIKELSQSVSYTDNNGSIVGHEDVYANDVYCDQLNCTTLVPKFTRQLYSSFACFNPSPVAVAISNNSLSPTILTFTQSTQGSSTSMSTEAGNVYELNATVTIGSNTDANALAFSLYESTGTATQNLLTGASVIQAAAGYVTLRSRIVFGTPTGTTPCQAAHVISYVSQAVPGAYYSVPNVGFRNLSVSSNLLQNLVFGAYQTGGSNTIALAQLQWKLVAN